MRKNPVGHDTGRAAWLRCRRRRVMPPRLLVLLGAGWLAGCALLPFGDEGDGHEPATPRPAADGAVRGEVLQYGLYRVADEAFYDDLSSGGVAAYDTLVHVERTRDIPLRADVTFGLRWRVTGLPEGQPATLVYQVDHPPMDTPAGTQRSLSREFEVQPVKGRFETVDVMALSEPWERVEGDWRVSISFQGQLLVRQEFHTRAADD